MFVHTVLCSQQGWRKLRLELPLNDMRLKLAWFGGETVLFDSGSAHRSVSVHVLLHSSPVASLRNRHPDLTRQRGLFQLCSCALTLFLLPLSQSMHVGRLWLPAQRSYMSDVSKGTTGKQLFSR